MRLTRGSGRVGPLDVKILGANQPLSAGRRYDLLCQSSGSRPPATITWWKNGQRLERTKETVRETIISRT
ncbi:CD80-like C2-set immunoglobulin domain [Popillia japonica]|uniref:CD80-like C2-set immunoglobulin domain n=1 Tax=Popillia japonica TaxID=7064 RepID=A0AAW1MC75_POPJA